MLVLGAVLTADVESSPIVIDPQRHQLQSVAEAVAVIFRILEVAEVIEIEDVLVRLGARIFRLRLRVGSTGRGGTVPFRADRLVVRFGVVVSFGLLGVARLQHGDLVGTVARHRLRNRRRIMNRALSRGVYRRGLPEREDRLLGGRPDRRAKLRREQPASEC
jgi:hypothetical protein